MPLITRLMLQNFKKFPELDLRFSNDRNILVGDNESGKSTILLALDLVLSDSRHRVEALGVESLLSQSAVRHFQEGERRADQLPVLTADVFLSNGGEPDLNGRQNLAGIDADGLRMRIAPMMEEYGQDIHHVWHCCKVSDEAAFCLIQRPYISKTLLTRRISPRG
ncbi:AAA family ATPase, partial [Escherichia coli]|uniref:AAA family ATPase n=1 Tax=Escherichia coli TaxID=562 RepID=UPI001F36FB8C